MNDSISGAGPSRPAIAAANNDAAPITGEQAIAILRQLGWFDDDRIFLSLRLTTSQFDKLQTAASLLPYANLEESITHACCSLIAANNPIAKEPQANG